MKTSGVSDAGKVLHTPLAGSHRKNISLKQVPGFRASQHPQNPSRLQARSLFLMAGCMDKAEASHKVSLDLDRKSH